MKTLSIIISFLFTANILLSQTTTAQPIRDTQVNGGKNVPNTVIQKFATEYPGEQPAWTLESGRYRAQFVDGSKMHGHAVAYDKAGNVLYREEKVDNFPSGVKDYYTANFPNDKYEVWTSLDKKGKRLYYSNHNLETLWFDEGGNFTSKGSLKKIN